MTTYPQFRVSQWLDNSDEAMARERATIIYGVQTKRAKGEKWRHVCNGSEPIFFDVHAVASEACDKLRRDDGK